MELLPVSKWPLRRSILHQSDADSCPRRAPLARACRCRNPPLTPPAFPTGLGPAAALACAGWRRAGGMTVVAAAIERHGLAAQGERRSRIEPASDSLPRFLSQHRLRGSRSTSIPIWTGRGSRTRPDHFRVAPPGAVIGLSAEIWLIPDRWRGLRPLALKGPFRGLARRHVLTQPFRQYSPACRATPCRPKLFGQPRS